jgi:hypothetical protein
MLLSRLNLIALLLLPASWPGCSGGDGQVPKDGSPPTSDTAGVDQVVLQAVVDKLILPKNAMDHAVDLNSDGAQDNQLGAIVGAIDAASGGMFDLQGGLNASITDGTLLLLYEVLASSITDDPQVVVRAHLGADPDGNPADNFSGSEDLAIAPGSPPNRTVPGSIQGGRLEAGPGGLMIALPISTAPMIFSLKMAQVQADLSPPPGGMADGRIAGAVPWSEVVAQAIPAIAADTDKTYKDPATDAQTVNLLRDLFDLNSDGTITTDEIQSNGLLQLILKPDIDTDGDQQADALSVGMGFTAKGCAIAGGS